MRAAVGGRMNCAQTSHGGNLPFLDLDAIKDDGFTLEQLKDLPRKQWPSSLAAQFQEIVTTIRLWGKRLGEFDPLFNDLARLYSKTISKKDRDEFLERFVRRRLTPKHSHPETMQELRDSSISLKSIYRLFSIGCEIYSQEIACKRLSCMALWCI